MRRAFILALICFCALAASCPAGATIRRVKAGGTGDGTSWTNAYGSIQNAVNASSSGDMVYLQGYTDGTTCYSPSTCIVLKDGVSIMGGFVGGSDDSRDTTNCITTISGSNMNDCVIYANNITNTTGTVLEYCTIQDGDGRIIDDDRYGGGIYCVSASPTISHCRIYNNVDSSYVYASYGGGIFADINSAPVIENCEIVSNSADYGGGVYLYKGTCVDNDISLNDARSGGHGGGVFFGDYGGTATTFAGNTVSTNGASAFAGYGGGVLLSYTCSSIVFSENTIEDNEAWGGGGIYSASGQNIKGCKIIGNNATYFGGGIHMSGGSLYCNVVKDNTASGFGGGVSMGGACSTFSNNTIVHNPGGSEYGATPYAVGISPSSTISLCNNIFYNNPGYALNISTSSDYNSYNNCFNGNDNDYNKAPANVQGTVTLLPGFASDGYHLAYNSPLIDTGYDDAVGSTWTDIDGEARKIPAPYLPISGGTLIVDIGADEFNDTTPPSTPRVTAYNVTSDRALCFSWSGVADDESGIHHYLYAVGTSEGGADIVSWTSISGSLTEYTVELTTAMAVGSTYYISLKAVNGMDLESSTGSASATYESDNLVIHVKSNGDDNNSGYSWQEAKATITGAMSIALSGNEIWVAAFTENGEPGAYVESDAINFTDGVALYGGFSGNELQLDQRDYDTNKTILDGNMQHYVITIYDCTSTNTRVDGFTIRNGNSCGSYGGGIACNNSNATISHNEICSNGYSGSYSGGGILIGGGSPTISGNKIHDNYGNYGGGIYYSTGIATITDNYIYSNTALYGGGGIYCTIATSTDLLKIKDNYIGIIEEDGTVKGNSAGATINNVTYSGRGGGIYITGYGDVRVIHNSILGNSANDDGGGIAYASYYDDINEVSYTPIIMSNIITGNSATSSNGGGIYCDTEDDCGNQNTLRIVNNSILDNVASGGAGIYSINNSVSVTNNTVAWNGDSSNNIGGGIYLSGSNYPYTVTNNIVAYNYGYSIHAATGVTSSVSYNDLYPANSWSGVSPSDCITSVPGFTSTTNHDIHISDTSPCYNTGANDAVEIDDTDVDYEWRIMDETVDIGADEVTGCVGYIATLTPENALAAVGGEARICATVRYANTTANTTTVVPGVTVNFSIDAGQINSIENSGVISDTINYQSGYGVTGSNGKAYIYVTRSTVGTIGITASVSSCSSTSTDTVEASFIEADSDDWPMFQHDLAHTGCTLTSLETDLEMKWVKTLSGSTDGILWSSPVVADGIVYVGTDSTSGDLYAFDADDGDQIAHVILESSIHGTPCVANGVVYIGTKDGVLHALDASDLSSEWSLSFSGQYITGSPVVYDGKIYIGTWPNSYQGYLRTIDIATQTQLNAAETEYKPDYTTPGIDTSFYDGARCYISDFSCYVLAVRCDTGAATWSNRGWHPDMSSFYSSPTICDGYIFGGSASSYIYRLIDTGDDYQETDPLKFSVSDSVNPTVTTFDGKLYFGSDDENMYCVDAETFEYADWTSDLGSSITSSSLLSTSTGLLFTCAEDGKLYATDISDGSSALIYDTSTEVSHATTKASLAAYNGRLYAVVGNTVNSVAHRYLYCFEP